MLRLAISLLAGISLVTACAPTVAPSGGDPAAVASAMAAVASAAANAAASANANANGVPTAAPSAAPAMPPRSTDVARIGLLTDPLPRALSLPSDTADVPRALAKRVMAGGDDALPALLAALGASGIAVVGVNDELVVRPAEPWQRDVLEPWEVRVLLASVLPERRVTMALPDFGNQLRVATGLDAPDAEKYLAADMRALASGAQSPTQFWARFVVELGRDAASTDDTDLARATDLTKVRLNGLQASLILRRLSADLLLRSGSGTRSGVPHVAASLLRSAPATEELPCTMNAKEKTIYDFALSQVKAAFGTLLDYFDKLGLANSGTSAVGQIKDAKSIASALLTYAKFIATYAALEVKVEMESAPLTRTKERRPSSGETKELTAAVRFSTGNAQVINCFRLLLNGVGLDFKVPQDGTLPGARVAWQPGAGFDQAADIRGGPEYLVHFAGNSSDGRGSANSITNAATDADGKTRVKVEGSGQRIKKSENATKVIKHASVHVDVALQGADLFKDLFTAATSAIGGVKALISLPAEMLYRSKWASEGHYTFEVIDWSGTQWSGTLSMTRTEVSKRDVAGRISQATTTDEATINIIGVTQYQSPGDDSIADMTGTIDGRYERNFTDTWNWTAESDSRLCVGKTFSGTDIETETSSGSGSGEAQIRVTASGLNYEIIASAADNVDDMPVSGQIQKQGHKFRQAGNGCQNVVVDKTNETLPVKRTEPMLGIHIKGTVDPEEGADHLTGSTTTVQDLNSTTSIRIKLTWDLRRD